MEKHSRYIPRKSSRDPCALFALQAELTEHAEHPAPSALSALLRDHTEHAEHACISPSQTAVLRLYLVELLFYCFNKIRRLRIEGVSICSSRRKLGIEK